MAITAPASPDTGPRITKGDLTELMRNAVRGHENSQRCIDSLTSRLNWFYARKRTIGRADVEDLVLHAVCKANPPSCDEAPGIAGARMQECFAVLDAHKADCYDCQELASLRRKMFLMVASAFDRYEGSMESLSDAELPQFTPGALILKCCVCGADMEVQRRNKTTCSDNCRQRLVTMRRKNAESQLDQPGSR